MKGKNKKMKKLSYAWYTFGLLLITAITVITPKIVYATHGLTFDINAYGNTTNYPQLYEKFTPTEGNSGLKQYFITMHEAGYSTTGTIAASLSNSECTISSDGTSYGTSANSSLSNGAYATFWVKSVNDELVDGEKTCTVTHTANVSDANFNGKTIAVPVNVKDNDGTVEIKASPTNGSIAESEVPSSGEGMFSYSLGIGDSPSSSVSVTATTNGQCRFLNVSGGKGGGGSVTQGSTQQTVTFNADTSSSALNYLYIGAVEDSKVEGNHTCTITHSVSTADAQYSGKTVGNVSVTIFDNDINGTPTNSNTAKPATSTPNNAQTTTSPKIQPSLEGSNLSEIKLNDNELVGDSKPVIGFGQPLVLKGKATPNATVKLYIFSEPRTATVVADANGNWSHTENGLEPGDHHVEAEVIDAATGVAGKRVEIARFSVDNTKDSATIASVSATPKNSRTKLFVAGGLLLAAVIAGGAFILWRMKKLPWQQK